MTSDSNSRNHCPRRSLSCLIGLLLIAGCVEKDWGYVTGTVTLNGQPIGPGSMMFEPMHPSSNTAPSAIAHFKEDGRYVLRSAGNREGAPVGEYRVLIHGRSEETFGDEQIDPEAASRIPGRYLNFRTGGLTATVIAGGNTIDFHLEP